MTLQTLLFRYRQRFLDRYGARLSLDQWSAFNALTGCRQGQYGHLQWGCDTCHYNDVTPCSCGHRACNQCQQQAADTWLQRQTQKQMPVPYFMVTFTLPQELRPLAQQHQRLVYDLLIRCASDTLKTFAQNDKRLQGTLGQCAVLHTHTRRLDYHPHVHIVVPGGALHPRRREWRKVKRYLFNGKALALVFRAMLLHALEDTGIKLPRTPKSWVVKCHSVGSGVNAIRYLSRYLYRGVISNKNLINDDGEWVTFRYQDSQSKQIKTRRVAGETFIWLLLQHVLPKGFRRSRDYGFLHGNAKSTIRLIQWLFRVPVPVPAARSKAQRACPCCHSKMTVVNYLAHWTPG